MTLSESQLETWSKRSDPASSSATYQRIRSVLEDTWQLAGRSVDIYRQGSYGAAGRSRMPSTACRRLSGERSALPWTHRPNVGRPVARVLSVEVRQSPEQGPILRYTCGVTHLGLGRSTNESRARPWPRRAAPRGIDRGGCRRRAGIMELLEPVVGDLFGDEDACRLSSPVAALGLRR